jgi:hypothetical protein
MTVRFIPTALASFVSNVIFSSNGGGTSSVVQGQAVAPPPPRIEKISPIFGPPGTIVTILGGNFGASAGRLDIGGVAASLASWTDSFIQATIPPLNAGNYIVTVSSVEPSNEVAFLVTDTPKLGDFRISALPASQKGGPASSIVYKVFLESVRGFVSPVTMSVTGLPSEITARFHPSVVSPSDSADLIVEVGEKASPGMVQFRIGGEAKGITHSIAVELKVTRNAGSVLQLHLSLSTPPLLLLTTGGYSAQSQSEVRADVQLHNLTGTWVTATHNVQAGAHPVSVNEKRVPAVLLLGPFESVKLGSVAFREGEYLQYDGDRANMEAMIATVIDAFLRGALGEELPPDAFNDIYSATGRRNVSSDWR